MKKLLIVDDEEKIREMVRKYAEFDGFEVSFAENGMKAIELCGANKFNIVVMDVMMPELDGFSAVKKIRAFSDVPVIMLSARGEEYDKTHGFELGIDDYVVKPFSPKELMMRVDAILRRAGQQSSDKTHDIFEFEGLHVDFTARKVIIDGTETYLTPKEYDLLFYFIKNKNIALTREKLITEVWGYDFYGDDRTLDTHIKLLRRSIGAYAGRITTLRGLGYRFDS